MADALTPSEQVLLHGEQFGKAEGMSMTPSSNVPLPHTDARVSARQLVLAMIPAALLAAESRGALRLELRERKALFGLMKKHEVVVVPAGAAEWPEGTVEAGLRDAAARPAKDGRPRTVKEIVTEMVPESTEPWGVLATGAMAAMAERGLVDRGTEKTLKVFTRATWTLNDAGRAARAAHPVEPLKAMLAEAERARPELWKKLQEEVTAAMVWRTESRD